MNNKRVVTLREAICKTRTTPHLGKSFKLGFVIIEVDTTMGPNHKTMKTRPRFTSGRNRANLKITVSMEKCSLDGINKNLLKILKRTM